MKQVFRGMPKEAKSSSLFYSQFFGVKHDSQVFFFPNRPPSFAPSKFLSPFQKFRHGSTGEAGDMVDHEVPIRCI